MKYDKISKSKMLKNKYANNILSYYKKLILSISLAVTTITLSALLVINLMKIKEVETEPKVILLLSTSDFNPEKLINDNPNVTFDHSKRMMQPITYYYVYMKYNVEIVQYMGSSSVIVQRSCIFIDEKGNVKQILYGDDFDVALIQEWIDYYGW